MSKIPISIKIFFLTLHLTFGYDFGFGNVFSKKVAKFLKYYSILLTSARFVVLLSPFKKASGTMWYWFFLIECVMNFCLLTSAKYNVYHLLSDLHAGEQIAVLKKDTFGVTTALYTFIVFVARGSFAVLNFVSSNKDQVVLNSHFINNVIYTLITLGSSVTPVSEIFIYYYIYMCLKNMKRSLKLDSDMNIFTERYNKTADCYDKISRLCDNMILMKIIIYIPKILGNLWLMLYSFDRKETWISTIGQWLYAFYPMIHVAIPAVIVQLIQFRLEDIIQLLNKKRMFETDPEKKAEIVRVMKYLKVRNMQHKVWGVIPTDLRLPIELMSICITYLIVLIQFTHLYD